MIVNESLIAGVKPSRTDRVGLDSVSVVPVPITSRSYCSPGVSPFTSTSNVAPPFSVTPASAVKVPGLLPGASFAPLSTRTAPATDPVPPSVPPATVIKPPPLWAPLIRRVPFETTVGPV